MSTLLPPEPLEQDPRVKAVFDDIRNTRKTDFVNNIWRYIAVSIANSCNYCIHSHSAACKAKGMTAGQHAEVLKIVSLSAKTNHLCTALAVPVDPVFMLDESGPASSNHADD